METIDLEVLINDQDFIYSERQLQLAWLAGLIDDRCIDAINAIEESLGVI